MIEMKPGKVLMPIIPVLGRKKQEDCYKNKISLIIRFQASKGYKIRPSLKKVKKSLRLNTCYIFYHNLKEKIV